MNQNAEMLGIGLMIYFLIGIIIVLGLLLPKMLKKKNKRELMDKEFIGLTIVFIFITVVAYPFLLEAIFKDRKEIMNIQKRVI